MERLPPADLDKLLPANGAAANRANHPLATLKDDPVFPRVQLFKS
jgi:hypothetical protein